MFWGCVRCNALPNRRLSVHGVCETHAGSQHYCPGDRTNRPIHHFLSVGTLPFGTGHARWGVGEKFNLAGWASRHNERCLTITQSLKLS